MRIKDILSETCAGSVAVIATSLGAGDPESSIYNNKKKKSKKTKMIRRINAESVDRKPRPRSKTEYVEINGVNVPIAKYSFGWAVSYGKFQGIGSFKKRSDLIAAIKKEMEK